MDKTLNDRVEEVFQGIVFIVFSFVGSLALLLCRPLNGYVLLAKRLRARSKDQIRPYAFVFCAMVLVFFLPSMIAAFAPPVAGTYEYQVHDDSLREPGALGRAYEETTQKIESKAASAIFVAAIVGVAAFHLGAMGSGLALFRLNVRRQTWRYALFFIGGLQIALLALAVVLDHFGWPSATETIMFRGFLFSPRTLFTGYREVRPYPLSIDVLDVALLALVLLVPFGAARRFASRLAPPFQGKGHRDWMSVVLLVVVVDFVAFGSFGLAAYVSDEVQPHEARSSPFTLQYLDCSAHKTEDKLAITGTVEVRSAAKDPWGFAAGDFQLLVGADRTDEDGPPPKRSRVFSAARIGGSSRMDVSFSAISPNLGAPPFLLQAGQAALVRFEADATSEIKFLAKHPDDQRCTLYYTQDYPIGIITSLRKDE
jgi:hypothetical protein